MHFSVFEFAPEGLALACFTLTIGVVASKNCDIFTDNYCCQKQMMYEQHMNKSMKRKDLSPASISGLIVSS